MKKNPGRKERRRLFFNNRSSHKFLKKFQEV